MRSFWNLMGYKDSVVEPIKTTTILQEIKNLPPGATAKESASDRSASTDTESDDLESFCIVEVPEDEDSRKKKEELLKSKPKDDPPERPKNNLSQSKEIPIQLSEPAPIKNSPDDFFLMKTAKDSGEDENLPNKHRPADDYVTVKKNDTHTFHPTDQVIKKNPTDPNNNPIRFFKHNPFGSVMSVLEAAGCAIFKFIAPKNAPSARAHYKEEEYDKEKVYTGVTSKGFPGFKSLRDDSLYESDLEIEALKYFSSPELEAIDQRAIAENYNLTEKVDDHPVFKKDIQTNNGTEEVVVTVADLRNYRIVKGQGIGLTTSYACCEGDCHRGNISKYGIRIDFDMLFWDYFCNYKESGIIDWSFRFPNDKTFIVTAKDILHLPNLEDADFFYWPTKQTVIPDTIRATLGKVFSFSDNAYTVEDNLVFQKLETHPVFIYHKYATLLKFMLTDNSVCRSLINLHLEKETFVNGINVFENLSLHLSNRIATFKKVLGEMPEFYKYLSTIDPVMGETYGNLMLNGILNEFNEHNAKYEKKIKTCERYKNLLINLEDVKQEYSAFMKNAKERYTDGVMSEFSLMEVKKEEPVIQASPISLSFNKKFN